MGLNTQDTERVQEAHFATEALNCVISKNGTLEARKGFARTNATAATGTPILDVVYSYVDDDGTEILISAGGNKLWSGTTSLTDKTAALTVTNDNWQFQTYKGEVFGYNGVDAPVYKSGSGNFATIASKGSAAGVVISSWHLSAFGRSWVGDPTSKTLIRYSDLLVPEDFTNGSAGSVDLDTVWPYSNDTITRAVVHNNNLVIFCERSIVIYSGADDVTSFYLLETIADNGCVARDSIQTIGNDLFYLANDGVRALSRTIIQDNMPLSEISKDIRDEMIVTIQAADLSKTRSSYNEHHGFYIINFVKAADVYLKTYVCDVRRASEGIFRWTTFDSPIYSLATSYKPTDELYAGLAGGFLSEYTGYNDTDTSDGSVDATYIVKYRSGWIDSGLKSIKSVWKKAVWYVTSKITVQLTTTWGFDFSTSENSLTKSLAGGSAPKYGDSVKYGSAKYGALFSNQQIKVPLSKTGSVIRLGFQSVVDGGQFSFNKIDLFAKQGRMK
jgi:hypothetical protein